MGPALSLLSARSGWRRPHLGGFRPRPPPHHAAVSLLERVASGRRLGRRPAASIHGRALSPHREDPRGEQPPARSAGAAPGISRHPGAGVQRTQREVLDRMRAALTREGVAVLDYSRLLDASDPRYRLSGVDYHNSAAANRAMAAQLVSDLRIAR